MPSHCPAHFTFFRRRLLFLFSSTIHSHRHTAEKWARRADHALPGSAPPYGGKVGAARPTTPYLTSNLPMTDEEAIDEVFSLFEMRAGEWATLHRNGRILLALPHGIRGALRALNLYQPQRFKARVTITLLRLAVGLGLHQWLLPKVRCHGGIVATEPALPRATPYTIGILLGSPEHRVRRAIASYQNDGQWEVAKISFGETGARVLEDEAAILEELQPLAAGVPRLLGMHRGHNVTVMRMPYLSGQTIPPGAFSEALHLLEQWISAADLQPITRFTEWAAIQAALSEIEHGERALERLMRECLAPVICHGDFARWNLLRKADGGLVVLDWEWGHQDGMPGIDLVHYFLQDARLVERLSPQDAIRKTCSILESPACRDYLDKTGWSGDPLLPIIASLAYKQGAGHQENGEMMEEILNFEF